MKRWEQRDREVLRILLGAMLDEEHSGDMTKALSCRFGNLSVLLESARLGQDTVGVPESVQLLFALIPELLRRREMERLGDTPVLGTRYRAGEYARALYIGTRCEAPLLICLDGEYRLIQHQVLEKGGLKDVSFRPRAAIQEALRCGAACAVLCHNHPSGYVEFSDDDVEATERLRDMFALVGVSLLDHLLIAGDEVIGLRGRRYVDEKSWLKSGPVMPPLGKWLEQEGGGITGFRKGPFP